MGRCAWCNSLERHRLLWTFLCEETDLATNPPQKFLHIAPEASLQPMLEPIIGDGYLTGDLLDPNVMEKIDITDIQHPDDYFDAVMCNHVLEHVPDDRKAMSEFYRVLKPGGWAILLVPINAEQTIEDPTITDPAERLRLFWQEDHVRRYGLDYIKRLSETGFSVKHIRPENFLTEEKVEQLGLHCAETSDIFLCTK